MDDCEPVSTAMALNCDEPPTALPSSTVPSESLAMDDANKKFEIDSSAIRSVPTSEQAEELQALGLNVYDQTVLEEGILQQVDRAFQQQENRRQRQTASKALESVLDDIRSVKIRLKQIDKALALMPKIGDGVCKEVRRQVEAIEREKENKLKHLKSLRAKQHSLSAHLDGESGFGDSDVDSEGNVLDVETKLQLDQVLGIQKALETEQEKLIRTGQMTPFGTVVTSSKLASGEPARRLKVTNELTDFEKYLLDQAQLQKSKLKKHTSPSKQAEQNSPTAGSSGSNKSTLGSPNTPGKRSASVKSEANNNGDSPLPSTSKLWPPLLSPPPKRKRRRKEDVGTLIEGVDDKKIRRKKTWPDPNANSIDLEELEREAASGSEYNPSGSQDSSSEEENKVREKIMMTKTKKAKNLKRSFDECSKDLSNSEEESAPLRIDHKKVVDDGNQADYLKRIKKWKRALLVEKHRAILRDGEEDGKNEEDEEVKEGFEEFEGGFRVPLQIWNKLFRYQQTCVRWMWELHCQRCGGIMGDEMGLGKTIQAITYLAGLSQSNVCSKDGKFKGLGPVIIVTPTTVMHQWVREFHAWWPPFRVAILHDSGSYTGTKESLVRNINSFPGILITSYNGITIHQDLLLKYDWHYILLDEGHKIRNPDARATLVCKQFRTPHRVILSGSPLQNSLKELWSLFDFIFPGKLGTLPVFMQQFAVPITHGGYSNASKVQVQTAYRCAVVLRDTISPYLLRRMKSDVKMNLDLPNKNEQVLFCRLTEEQRSLYKEYLDSKEIQSILDGRLQVFVGLVNLRKICNHPDLYSGGPKVFGKVDPSTLSEDMHYGYWKRAGKMVVIEAILKLWFRQGHRVLLFSQSKQMLDILERFIKIQNYTFLRMDGGTSIGSRQPLVAKFNNDPSIFIFLLTTRVGGLGVNLTGANRVVIYDPDWNPSTDMQARERAWRIGQRRDVTIYRLLTSGTIEEKIYHRQIFKQFLTNRVLKDPRQRRFFKSNDMFELFSLRDEGTQGTETSAIFSGTGSEVQVPSKADQKKATGEGSSTARSCLSDDKIKKMRDLAKKLSQKIGEKASKEPGREPNDETEAGPSMATDLTCSGVCHGKENLEKGRLQDNRRKKKKRQATKFEGVKMDFLVRKDTFKSTGQEQEESATNVRQDEYVLQKLFAKTGVHAALKHDTIIDASDPDYMLVEGEADRVAKEAVKVLKNSRRHCYHAESGIPTWTGSNGLSGAPPEFKAKARFGKKRNTKLLTPNQEVQSLETDKAVATMSMRLGESRKAFLGEPQSSSTGDAPMSSSQLLFRMKQRNHLNPAVANDDDEDDENLLSSSAVTSDGGVAAEQRLTTEYDELLVDIRNFIAFQCAVDGEATTEEILQTFKDRVPAKDSAVFKALLKKICIFARNVHGTGVWQLRGEFR